MTALTDRRTSWAITIAVFIFCLVSWYLFDIPATRFFAQFSTAPWIGFWKVVTRAGQAEWYLIGGLVLYLGFLRKNRTVSRTGLFLFASVAVSGLAADLVKMLVGRARPKLLLQEGIYGFDGIHFEHLWTSFPSGHSATGMSVALTLSLLFPKYRVLFFSCGLLIAFSRLVLCQHYLSDVVAGSALGIATVLFLYQRYFSALPDEVRSL